MTCSASTVSARTSTRRKPFPRDAPVTGRRFWPHCGEKQGDHLAPVRHHRLMIRHAAALDDSLARPVYHVTSTTLHREQVFRYFSRGRIVVQSMRRENDAGNVKTLAFVVMPDHFHWLIVLSGRSSLSGTVKSMKSYSARRINSMARRKGRIWQRGFRDREIRCDDELRRITRFIVADPLRAGLVDSIREYPLWDADVGIASES